MEKVTLAGGCFWCTEAIFKRLKGVKKVMSGYSGGDVENPTYEQVCSGETGHAEAIQITYDPKVISYEELLEVFFKIHDPTTLNRQGNDIGSQYRSVIFYRDKKQKELTEMYVKKLNDGKTYDDPIVTVVVEFKNFYLAEAHHQDYYNNNKNKPYCRLIIGPKLEKLQRDFKDKLA